MKLKANGLSHLGLRVTNLARAKRFYVDTLGCQLVREIDGAVLVNVYGTLIGPEAGFRRGRGSQPWG